MNTQLPAKVIEKFWANVEKTDTCWLWTGSLSHGVPGKDYSARRLSLQISGSELPSNCMVLPSCRNKLCVNPSHLIFGDEARFWNKVQKLSEVNGSCWIWTGSQVGMYGKFKVDGTITYAHIYSWQLYTGRIVPEGLLVCHHCDHPYCVNPEHLFLGTQVDNMKDMTEKGRSAKGEAFPQSKLTDNTVREVRACHALGESITSIARAYGMSATSISLTVRRKTWKHV